MLLVSFSLNLEITHDDDKKNMNTKRQQAYELWLMLIGLIRMLHLVWFHIKSMIQNNTEGLFVGNIFWLYSWLTVAQVRPHIA